MRSRFFAVFLALLLAVVLQAKFGYIPNFPFNFSLVVLLIGAFFLDLWELLVLVSLGALVMNWQPAASLEMIVFAALPLVALAAKKFLPWHAWLNNVLVIFGSLLVFYLAIDARFFVENLGAFLPAFFMNLVFGLVLFQALHFSYGSETE